MGEGLKAEVFGDTGIDAESWNSILQMRLGNLHVAVMASVDNGVMFDCEN